MRLLLLFISSALLAAGQITVEPGSPSTFVATAGTVSCIISGNSTTATRVNICCTVGATPYPAHGIPLIEGGYHFLDMRKNGDAVTAIFSMKNGVINYQVAATPSGGTELSNKGTL